MLDSNGGVASNQGGVDNYDISGDTNVGFVAVGHDPVFMASAPGGGRIWVANQTDDSLSTYATLAPTSGASTVSLAAGARPGFLATTEVATMYAAETGTNKVAAISQNQLVLLSELAVPASPKLLVELPNASKLYSINSDGSISDIAPSNFSAAPANFASGGTDPRWAVASPDSAFLFVVDGASNTIFVVNTSTDAVTAVTPGLSTPVFAAYDTHFRRLYVVNSGSSSVSILDATTPPALPPLTAAPVGVGSAPVQVAVLPDGSRAYVANSGSATVSIINGGSLTLAKTLAVGTSPVSIAAAGDSSRVYVANRNTPPGTVVGSVSIIRTLDDTVVVTATPTLGNPIQVIMAQ